jgi:ribosomal protein S18 acetylase RimI-like enzyme
MIPDGYTIRPATCAELDRLVDWAAAEGWNPGLDDAEAFRAADPEGFLIGLIEDEPVAGISVVRYGDDFGFLGLYIVRPEYRGKGYGWAIWQAGMARLQGRNVGLDGVVAQQDNYRRSGFVLAHRNVRYAGRINAPPVGDPHIVPLQHVPFDDVTRYDRLCFPASRDVFLRAWLDPAKRTGRAYVEDGRLLGYGVVRASRDGFKVGPLFADRADVAEALLRSLAAEARGGCIHVDPPEPNREAVAMVEGLGLLPVFETARMYTGGDPALPLERIYGITTFELG